MTVYDDEARRTTGMQGHGRDAGRENSSERDEDGEEYK